MINLLNDTRIIELLNQDKNGDDFDIQEGLQTRISEILVCELFEKSEDERYDFICNTMENLYKEYYPENF